jgi:hypothetical protein
VIFRSAVFCHSFPNRGRLSFGIKQHTAISCYIFTAVRIHISARWLLTVLGWQVGTNVWKEHTASVIRVDDDCSSKMLIPTYRLHIIVKQKTTSRTEIAINAHVKLRRLSSLIHVVPNSPPVIFKSFSSITIRGGF